MSRCRESILPLMMVIRQLVVGAVVDVQLFRLWSKSAFDIQSPKLFRDGALAALDLCHIYKA